MNYLYLLFVFETLYVFGAIIISKKDLLSPSFISGCCFWLSILCNIINEKRWEIVFHNETFTVIVLGQLALLAGEACAILLPRIVLGKNTRKVVVEKLLLPDFCEEQLRLPDWKHYALALFNFIFFILFFATVMKSGFSLATIALYKEENDGLANMNIFVQQSFRFLIACAIFYAFLVLYNRIVFKSVDRREFIFCVYTNLLACLESILAASRRNIIVILIAWFVIFVVLDNRKNGWRNRFPTKMLKKCAIFLCVLMVVFRNLHSILKSSASNLDGLFSYVTYYIGCPIQTLNVYFERHSEAIRSEFWGQYTLPSLASFLKLMPKDTDSSFGFVYLGGQANAASNVYTFFLAPLQDFGLVGMFLFTFIVGFVYSRFYYKGIRNHSINLVMSYKLCVYSFIYWIIPLAFYLNGMFFIVAPTCLISIACFYLIFLFAFKLNLNK